MSETNPNKITTTDMTNNVPNYEVASVNLDSATGAKETEYINTNAAKYWGFYKKTFNFKKAIDALAIWCVGKGYVSADLRTETILEDMHGWGEDTFNSIAWNLFVTKKVCGDAFAEIIRDDKGNLINLKPLNPANIKIIVDEKGLVKRYEQINVIGKSGKMVTTFQPKDILHLCNDRVADEIHGTAVTEVCEWVTQTIQEILDDYKAVLHRNVVPVRILEVDTDDVNKIAQIRTTYETAIKNKEVIIVPKGAIDVKTDGAVQNSIINPQTFLNYLDNVFYTAVGVPRIILGGSAEFTEASSKIAYLTFEQVVAREQAEFEADIWDQLGFKIKLNKPASLQNELLSDNAKDTQTGMVKPSEMTPTMTQE